MHYSSSISLLIPLLFASSVHMAEKKNYINTLIARNKDEAAVEELKKYPGKIFPFHYEAVRRNCTGVTNFIFNHATPEQKYKGLPCCLCCPLNEGFTLPTLAIAIDLIEKYDAPIYSSENTALTPFTLCLINCYHKENHGKDFPKFKAKIIECFKAIMRTADATLSPEAFHAYTHFCGNCPYLQLINYGKGPEKPYKNALFLSLVKCLLAYQVSYDRQKIYDQLHTIEDKENQNLWINTFEKHRPLACNRSQTMPSILSCFQLGSSLDPIELQTIN